MKYDLLRAAACGTAVNRGEVLSFTAGITQWLDVFEHPLFRKELVQNTRRSFSLEVALLVLGNLHIAVQFKVNLNHFCKPFAKYVMKIVKQV